MENDCIAFGDDENHFRRKYLFHFGQLPHKLKLVFIALIGCGIVGVGVLDDPKEFWASMDQNSSIAPRFS